MVARGSFWKPVLIAAAVAIFIGVLGGTLTDTGTWYQSLLQAVMATAGLAVRSRLDPDLCAGDGVRGLCLAQRATAARNANG